MIRFFLALLLGMFFAPDQLVDEWVEGPASWSPDDTQLVYTTPFNGALPKIYIVDTNGSDPRLLIYAGRSPVWSPDGSKIVFFGYILDYNALWVVTPDQSQLQMIVPEVALNDAVWSDFSPEFTRPSWSPDSQRLVFGVDGGWGQEGRIYRVNADGTQLTNLTPDALDDDDRLPGLPQPVWSPDGQHIAFVGYRASASEGGLYVMNADGSDPHLLTSPVTLENVLAPTWSPDGTRMLFSRSRRIWVVNTDGSGETPLTDPGPAAVPGDFGDAQPVWSPDGSKIAFVRGSEKEPGLYVMYADGTHLTRLAQSYSYDLGSFGYADLIWSHDSRRLAFTSHGTNPGLYRIMVPDTLP